MLFLYLKQVLWKYLFKYLFVINKYFLHILYYLKHIYNKQYKNERNICYYNLFHVYNK